MLLESDSVVMNLMTCGSVSESDFLINGFNLLLSVVDSLKKSRSYI